MGSWSAGVWGNDTAQDLQREYAVAFWKYEVPEALEKLDRFVRQDFDESDEAEWADYRYSLADFMWKHGILTGEVRDRTLAMIDGGFGLSVWEESDEKALRERKKALTAFREKLLSPMPPKKKIRPKVNAERIFRDGDLIALELQTAGKPYTGGRRRGMSEEAFHACDGKFVLVQLLRCTASWSSALDPEVRDYWAEFRLFNGLYDAVPEAVDPQRLESAAFLSQRSFTAQFCCESSMYWFRRRKARVVANDPAAAALPADRNQVVLSLGVNRPWTNPDSDLLAAMGKEVVCAAYRGPAESCRDFIYQAVAWHSFDYRLSKQENEERFWARTEEILTGMTAAEEAGGTIWQLRFGGLPAGLLTQCGKRLDALYIRGELRNKGFGTQLLRYGLSLAGSGAYLEAPADHAVLRHLCAKLGMREEPGAGPDTVCLAMP